MGLRIRELERLYGVEYGGDRKSSYNKYNLKTQEDIAKKMGMRIRELERLYEIRNGSTSFQGNQHTEVVSNKLEAPTQEQLASQMGISVDTLQNYKLLADMIPELSDLVDTGIVTKTTALAMMKNLSEMNMSN